MATIFLKADELVNGKKGAVYFTIDNRRSEMAGIQSIEAHRTVNTSTFATVGTTRNQTRALGVDGTGSMTVNYWMVKIFSAMVDQYEKTGLMPKWDIMIVNEEVGATIGTQTVQLFGCHLTGDVPLAALDASNDEGLTIDVSFAFDRSENLQNFNDPQRVGREG